MLINSERVGGLGSRADDVLVLGDCDAGVRKLAAALGWQYELEALWNETGLEHRGNDQGVFLAPDTRDDELGAQIASLTEEIDKSLQISSEFDTRTRRQMEKDLDPVSTGAECLTGSPLVDKSKASIDGLSSQAGSVQMTTDPTYSTQFAEKGL